MTSPRWLASAAAVLCACTCSGEINGVDLDAINLPPGYTISVFAEVEAARSLCRAPGGTIFVGSRKTGKVVALTDADGDGRAERTRTVAEGLHVPNGVAVHNGDLYIAEQSRVIKLPAIEQHLDDPPAPVVIRDDLPTDDHHGWKFLAFGPDGWLYVPVGAPCNVCLREDDPRYASILRMRPDGSELEIFAEGVRNTVGFTWHPETGEMWFTDNGRDHLGDDLPPDELNHAPTAGLHFGFPNCHGTDIRDEQFGELACSEFTPAAQELGPHVAALGLRFYTGANVPQEHHGKLLIAEHGSWNRSVPIGYRITEVQLDGDTPISYDVFADGWLRADGSALGRPVDLEVLPDGALLVSDDGAGLIYRIAPPSA